MSAFTCTESFCGYLEFQGYVQDIKERAFRDFHDYCFDARTVMNLLKKPSRGFFNGSIITSPLEPFVSRTILLHCD